MKKEPQHESPVMDVSSLEAAALGPIIATQAQRLPESYWDIVARQFRKNKIAVCGLFIVIALFGIALGADFIANDKPLVMSYAGQTYFPVLKDYAVWLHLSQWQPVFQNISYKDFTAANFKD